MDLYDSDDKISGSSLGPSCWEMFPGSLFLSVYLSFYVVTILLYVTVHLYFLQCVYIDHFLEAHCLLESGPVDTSFPHSSLSLGHILSPTFSDPHSDMVLQITLQVWTFPMSLSCSQINMQWLAKLIKEWAQPFSGFWTSASSATQGLRTWSRLGPNVHGFRGQWELLVKRL